MIGEQRMPLSYVDLVEGGTPAEVTNRLTEFLRIEHPILLAPMNLVSGGRLAAAVTSAGGLGLIGGGYSDADWLRDQFGQADGARVGCAAEDFDVAGISLGEAVGRVHDVHPGRRHRATDGPRRLANPEPARRRSPSRRSTSRK